MYLKRTGWEDLDWIYLVHDRVTSRAQVNTVVKFRDPQHARNSWLAEQLSATREKLCPLELFVTLDVWILYMILRPCLGPSEAAWQIYKTCMTQRAGFSQNNFIFSCHLSFRRCYVCFLFYQHLKSATGAASRHIILPSNARIWLYTRAKKPSCILPVENMYSPWR
jgi:hypothetical protein